MKRKEFDRKFQASLNTALEGMAGNPEVDVKKFYGMVYFLENLTFFSPLLYDFLKKGGDKR